jgi:nicotinamidase-related amidase
MPEYTVPVIDPCRSALIVVDMQADFVAPGAPLEVAAARAAVPAIGRAIETCRANHIPVIYTAHTHRRDGSDLGLFRFNEMISSGRALRDGSPGVEVYGPIAPLPGELVLRKHRFSAFYGTELEDVLRERGVTTVIVCGATTENCCHATARDALFRDFEVVFLSDATGTFDYYDDDGRGLSAAEVQHATLVIIAMSTGDVITVDELIARIEQR